MNRHYYSADEIAQEVTRPVVRSLFALIRLRNTHEAFDGTFTSRTDGAELTMTWQAEHASLTLTVDCASGVATISGSGITPSLLTELV